MKEKDDLEGIALTEAELKQFKGFENVSSEEAKTIIDTLEQLAVIAYQYYMQVKRGEENQQEEQNLIVKEKEAKRMEKRERSAKFNNITAIRYEQFIPV